MKKTKVGIIGTGNIGTDLLLKIQKSPYLECSIFAGRNFDSPGIHLANELGVQTTTESIDYFLDNPSCCKIVIDATSAETHKANAEIFRKMGMFAIDLTPAHIGPFCIPVINPEVYRHSANVNLITCGGQATIPIATAISRVCKNIQYIEMVATISSKSAGIGTRNNIDEFTQTTRDALSEFTGIQKTKAIIILNPAEPAITMRNTLYVLVENPDMDVIIAEAHKMEKRIQQYVPGYEIIVGPVYENGRITTTIQVVGRGDYLPKYSGNLDIITCAAVEIAEQYAQLNVGEVSSKR